MKTSQRISIPVLLLTVIACSGESETGSDATTSSASSGQERSDFKCGTLGLNVSPELPTDRSRMIEVSDYAALVTAIHSGYAYIKVPNGVTIEIPNQSAAVVLGEHQTLFGERGISDNPGRLRVAANPNPTEDSYPVIRLSSYARITGLMIEGPVQVSNTTKSTIGLQSQNDSEGIVFDNNEIFGWPWAGISLKRSKSAKVSHNYIHHNIKTELGYGVVVQNGETTADIECNIFDHNRHAIAGSGALGEGYTASYNLVMQGGGKAAYHQFDMHAKDGYGGSYVKVYNNWFNYGDFGTANRSSVMIRAIPSEGPIEVKGNVFKSDVMITSTQPAVDGVDGSIPDEAALRANNQFLQAFEFTREENGQCMMRVGNQTVPVFCRAVSL
ncbi:right-handed parallel beta-helix repeat-containing protein [Photobacterium sp. CCB-ST2H9]|uniref:right-handed parallel beta-helix repeat-containing protein n=1 Tax=Photobacterium sp. CCB-ST2H9 TaxID=2912855 RepID=UPI0020060385|nr:right-handed parallel beta-helix repeat-containing protein [Photobacterium sp. CCB-ST2H9]UTM59434.1 right-handed parallel beta-helix repeat-containing protein [Photobacterium sp. CCB-ST2H9]